MQNQKKGKDSHLHTIDSSSKYDPEFLTATGPEISLSSFSCFLHFWRGRGCVLSTFAVEYWLVRAQMRRDEGGEVLVEGYCASLWPYQLARDASAVLYV